MNSTNSTKNLPPKFDKIIFKGNEEEYQTPQRNYFFRAYHDLEKLKELFKLCSHWAYILHDKDDKAPHCHCIVILKSAKTPSAFCKFLYKLDSTQGAYVDILNNRYTAFDYMVHRDDGSIKARKHAYNVSEVISDDVSYFDRIKTPSKTDSTDFVNDLLEGRKSFREMAVLYGRDYMRNHKNYHDFATLVAREENTLSRAQKIDTYGSTNVAHKIADNVLAYINACDRERVPYDYFKLSDEIEGILESYSNVVADIIGG